MPLFISDACRARDLPITVPARRRFQGPWQGLDRPRATCRATTQSGSSRTLGALLVALGGILIAQNAGLTARVDGIETRLEGLDTRLRAVEVALGEVDRRMAALERTMLSAGE